MVGVAGFEPATLRLSSACSNQLSYTPSDPDDSEIWIQYPGTRLSGVPLFMNSAGGGKGSRTPDL